MSTTGVFLWRPVSEATILIAPMLPSAGASCPITAPIPYGVARGAF